MGCNTLEVINGSVLTFEAIVQICDSSVFNTYDDLTHFHFTDKLQQGLTIDEPISNSITAQYSSDFISYINFDSKEIETAFDLTTQLLDVQIPKDQFKNLSFPLYVKVTFKAKVYDMDKLLSVKDDNGNYILKNQGVFNTVEKDEDTGDIVQYFSKDALVNYSSVIKEYSPEVSGYSINVCPSDTDVLEAKFCLNTICGDFEKGHYVLTFTAPDGISFYTDDTTYIKVYTGCCCKSAKIIQDITPAPYYDSKTVGITITSENVRQAMKDNPDDSCNNNISIYIPYKFDNTAITCTNKPLLITGSMKFYFTLPGDESTILAELKNFGLYVNVDCGNLVGIGKTILC